MQTPQRVAKNAPAVGARTREFLLTDNDFERIRRIVGEQTGIALSDKKRELVYSRLAKRLRHLELETFADYCRLIERGDTHELLELINSITTNLTAFYRESHHFDYLHQHLVEEIDARPGNRSLSIWSAGCSSGEEPYSIAMTVAEALPHWGSTSIRIVATDLDSNMVAHAHNGIYAIDRVRGIPQARLKQWFQRGTGSRSGLVRMSPKLRQSIDFHVLNLMGEWSVKGPLDAIFCRNVMIYFSKETQRVLVDRFANLLAPGGHLFLGHSESLHAVSDRFESLGKTIYRKQR